VFRKNSQTKEWREEMTLANQAKKIFGVKQSPEIQDELSVLYYDYDRIDEKDATILKSKTIQVRRLLRQTFESVILLGQHLAHAKSILGEVEFKEWLKAEFQPYIQYSVDTLTNAINTTRLLEFYTEDQLQNIPLTTLYTLARSTVPSGARDHIIGMFATGANPSTDEVKAVVATYRALKINNASTISPQVKEIIVESPIAENSTELERLGKLSQRKQLEVANLILNTEEADMSVRKALQTIRQRRLTTNQPQLETEQPDETAIETKKELLKGDWLTELSSLKPNSVDLLFVNAPLGKSWLDEYGRLAIAANTVLTTEGYLIATCGHYNITRVGSKLEPLIVRWTFAIRRQPGRSARIPGLNIFSSWVPLVFASKDPYKSPANMIDDSRTEQVGQSLEECISYYIKFLLKDNGTFVNVVVDENASFDLDPDKLILDKAARYISIVSEPS
jgi:hypothetical protein